MESKRKHIVLEHGACQGAWCWYKLKPLLEAAASRHFMNVYDVTLAKMLLRPGSLFREDLSKESAFSKQGFGSVEKSYIVSTKDKVMPVNFQRWQIETSGVALVKEISNAEHMPMLSKPHQLCQLLLQIANNY